MKMMKSLILGTAVAFAATAGAQAADLPVKAKPVSYVKICPQYGPGFYYIPGTDICLKVGGIVFAEAGYHAGGVQFPLKTRCPGRAPPVQRGPGERYAICIDVESH